ETGQRPIVLALSRQNVPTLDRSQYASADGLRKGAYVLKDCEGEPQLILIGTGAEVGLCVQAAEKLNGEGVRTRVVSMPSWELFAKQDQAYRDSVLPPNVHARLAVEAGSPQGWERWVGQRGEMLKRYGFTMENVVAKAKALLS